MMGGMPRIARRSPGWVRTILQVVPDFFQIVRCLRPTFHLNSVEMLDLEFLKRHDLQGIIWDVDGTLTSYHDVRLAPRVEPAFRKLLQSPKLRHVIVSNSSEERSLELAEMFPTVPVLALLDDDLRSVRKPSAELIDRARQLLQCPADRVVMVGDQLFTDIASANLAGIRSIKVPTLARETFPLPLRTLQRMEDLLFRLLYDSS